MRVLRARRTAIQYPAQKLPRDSCSRKLYREFPQNGQGPPPTRASANRRGVALARVATGRPAILAFRYGYHGRTAQTMALTTAKDVYRAAFEPLPGSVYHTPYPYCYRAAGGAHAPTPMPRHPRARASTRPSTTS